MMDVFEQACDQTWTLGYLSLLIWIMFYNLAEFTEKHCFGFLEESITLIVGPKFDEYVDHIIRVQLCEQVVFAPLPQVNQQVLIR